MAWPKDDLTIHSALMKVLDEATLELKGKEVVAFSQVYMWVKNMPHNYTKSMKKKAKNGNNARQSKGH
jgi:hypothetical protein